MPALTRSPAQKSACKDLERDGQARAITPEAAYTPTSNRAGSRSHKKSQKDMTCGAHKSYLSGFA
ncbi:hypothetical protein HMPREF0541_02703 [Lacticaseibacillus rhamnosus ATCC 21052]|nr:hypothetical protein HMPREF0541_02703 [Lacticaseibacillus rhamnosus ATCC 21052]